MSDSTMKKSATKKVTASKRTQKKSGIYAERKSAPQKNMQMKGMEMNMSDTIPKGKKDTMDMNHHDHMMNMDTMNMKNDRGMDNMSDMDHEMGMSHYLSLNLPMKRKHDLYVI